MTMLNIAKYGEPDRLIPPTSYAAKYVAVVRGNRDDDCLSSLGIRIIPPKPTQPPAAVKAGVDPKALDNALYGQPVPCFVPVEALKRFDRVQIFSNKPPFKVAIVTGRTAHLEGGLSICAADYPGGVKLMFRAEIEPDTRKLPLDDWKKTKTFPKARVDPQCPSSQPNPVPVARPEPETVTMESALITEINGPTRRLVEKTLPPNVTLYLPGDHAPMNEPSKPKYHVTSYDEMLEKAGKEAADQWEELNRPLREFLQKKVVNHD